jgi:8-oxo-dGTP pyrophosphatase MutT (NUDIX family)
MPKVVVAGRRFDIVEADLDIYCNICNIDNQPTLEICISSSESTEIRETVNLCESCSKMLGWAWGQVTGEFFGQNAPWKRTEPSVAIVLVVKENPAQPNVPFEMLAVERKAEPDCWGAPGGKIEVGETPEKAAVRELYEETGLLTWTGALELIYVGYNDRGLLVNTYLCRGYYGAPQSKETTVTWKPWPFYESLNWAQGYYRGVCSALLLRSRLQKARQANSQLTIPIRKPAAEVITLRLKQKEADANRGLSPFTDTEIAERDGDTEMINALSMSISSEEDIVVKAAAGPLPLPRLPRRKEAAERAAAPDARALAPVAPAAEEDDDDDGSGGLEDELE